MAAMTKMPSPDSENLVIISILNVVSMSGGDISFKWVKGNSQINKL